MLTIEKRKRIEKIIKETSKIEYPTLSEDLKMAERKENLKYK